jgi:hypothetical protein
LVDFESLANEVYCGLPKEFRTLCADVVIRIEDFQRRGAATLPFRPAAHPCFVARPRVLCCGHPAGTVKHRISSELCSSGCSRR